MLASPDLSVAGGEEGGQAVAPGIRTRTSGNEWEMDAVERHLLAAETHDAAAVRHEEAATSWAVLDDVKCAELEQRNAGLERAAGQLERDRAQIEKRRPTRR